MSKGGRRQGAGRPKGAKNRPRRLVPADPVAATANVATTDESPLEFLLRLMHDPSADERTRLEAAKTAAQYLHPKADGGKKARADEAATKVATGRFATPPPPPATEWGDDLIHPDLLDKRYRQ